MAKTGQTSRIIAVWCLLHGLGLSLVLSEILQCERGADGANCYFYENMCKWSSEEWERKNYDHHSYEARLDTYVFTKGSLTSPKLCSTHLSFHCLQFDYEFIHQSEPESKLTVFVNEVGQGRTVVWELKDNTPLVFPASVPIKSSGDFKIIFQVERPTSYIAGVGSFVALSNIVYREQECDIQPFDAQIKTSANIKPPTPSVIPPFIPPFSHSRKPKTSMNNKPPKIASTVKPKIPTTISTAKMDTSTLKISPRLTTLAMASFGKKTTYGPQVGQISTTEKKRNYWARNGNINGRKKSMLLALETTIPLVAATTTYFDAGGSHLSDQVNGDVQDWKPSGDQEPLGMHGSIIGCVVGVIVIIAVIIVVVVVVKRRHGLWRRKEGTEKASVLHFNANNDNGDITSTHARQGESPFNPPDVDLYSMIDDKHVSGAATTTTTTTTTTTNSNNLPLTALPPVPPPHVYSVVNKARRNITHPPNKTLGELPSNLKSKPETKFDLECLPHEENHLSAHFVQNEIFEEDGEYSSIDLNMADGFRSNQSKPANNASGLNNSQSRSVGMDEKYGVGFEDGGYQTLGDISLLQNVKPVTMEAYEDEYNCLGFERKEEGRGEYTGEREVYSHLHTEQEDTYSQMQRHRRPVVVLDQVYSHLL